MSKYICYAVRYRNRETSDSVNYDKLSKYVIENDEQCEIHSEKLKPTDKR